jgi:hypothetical protein
MTVYNEIGKGYSIHRQADSRIVESIYQLLDLPANSCVIDVGAGTGNYSNAIAEKGHIVYAVEPSIEMRLQATYHPNVTCKEYQTKFYSLEAIIAVGYRVNSERDFDKEIKSITGNKDTRE